MMASFPWNSALVVVCLSTLSASVGCGGPSRVSFMSNERPSAAGAPNAFTTSRALSHAHPNGVHDLPNDAEDVEPERPAADSVQERALVHIHGPNGVVCSGVVLGPRVVATSQQCVKGEPRGVTMLPDTRSYKVELASSTLTWTARRAQFVVVPACDWQVVDLALLVLSEATPWVKHLDVASVPGTGARVQALGFGRCSARPVAMNERFGVVRSRADEAFVIDAPLCKGDQGGPVVDGARGAVIGIISHRDDPTGSPLRTTTIARLDTTSARKLLAQANEIAAGASSSAPSAYVVACE